MIEEMERGKPQTWMDLNPKEALVRKISYDITNFYCGESRGIVPMKR